MKMKKTITMLLVLSILAVSMVACSSPKSADGSTTTTKVSSKASKEPKPLEIVEKGYGLLKSGNSSYLYYGFLIKNPNEDIGISYQTVRITAKSADGTILGTSDVVLSDIYPNQTIAAGNQAFSVEAAPETVEFEVLAPEEYNIVKAANMEINDFVPLKVENINVNKDKYRTKFLGEVVNNNQTDLKGVAVTIIFRDKDGKIVGGDTTYTNSVTANGKLPFEISPSKDLVTETYEIHAKPWL